MMKKGLLLAGLILAGGAFAAANLDPILFRPQIQEEPTLNQMSGYDLESDFSFEKFLDNKHPFSNKKYEPIDLQAINSDFTFNNARKFQLRKKASEQFADMAWHFWNENKGKKLSINSAYRSFSFQEILRKGCAANHCAEAGTSEHQAGLALDLGVNWRTLDQKSLTWLKENAHKRGFHQTYQKGENIDGKKIEPWHWRYVGNKLAAELFEKKMSFAERFYIKNLDTPHI